MDNNTDFPKAGFARLLKSFENTDDVVKLTRAFGLATKVHRGQLFSKSEPYINHALRVATILVEELQLRDCELACAALLHDTLEAADEDLKEYGERVHSIVSAATEPKVSAEEKAEILEQYFRKISQAPKDARYVKLADRLDGVRSMKGKAMRAARYKEETEKYVTPLAMATDDRLAFKLSVALYELR
ncbi:MAG: HD domain-containing protein [Nitrososphaera sp.]